MTTLKMSWPANCKVVTQRFGNKSSRYVSGVHTGLDIGCISGSPIFAAHDGVVTFAGWNGAYGNEVRVKYSDALETSYHHMSRTAAYKGDRVSAGKIIGYIGSTGNSTGPHLHFEVRENGKAVDPMGYLSGGGVVPIASGGDNPLIPDVIEGPWDALTGVLEWLTETKNWYRIGLILGGVLLVLFALIGVAKTRAMGAVAGGAVKSTVAKVKGGVKNGSGKS